MVSGCVGFVGVFALTFGPSPVGMARIVRKVSRIFQAGAVSTATCNEPDSGTEKSSFSKPITRPSWSIISTSPSTVVRLPSSR